MFSTRKREGNEENEQICQAYFLSLEVAFYVSTRKVCPFMGQNQNIE
jgi:hypothetical protein